MTTTPTTSLFWILTSLCAPAVFAIPIPISNPSFESVTLSEGEIRQEIAEWDTSPGGGDGVFHPTAIQYPGGLVPNGENVAYVNDPGNRVVQTLTAVLEAETRYVLRVDVGRRLEESYAGYLVQLRAGGVVLAQDDSTRVINPGEFVTTTASYVAEVTDPLLGQPLEIWLLSPGVQVNYDNVRLDASSITPIPALDPRGMAVAFLLILGVAFRTSRRLAAR